MTMANFNPPDSHWADDFDARLRESFVFLKEKVEALELLVSELVKDNSTLRAELKQAVSDAAHYYKTKGTW